jgi:hypothetical protein
MSGRSGRTSLAWAVLAYQYIRVAYDWIDASIVWRGRNFRILPGTTQPRGAPRG